MWALRVFLPFHDLQIEAEARIRFGTEGFREEEGSGSEFQLHGDKGLLHHCIRLSHVGGMC
jgi:hypothetical protein